MLDIYASKHGVPKQVAVKYIELVFQGIETKQQLCM